jgi:hypothetical protein
MSASAKSAAIEIDHLTFRQSIEGLEPLVTATVSMTTLLSVMTLLGWLYALSGLSARAG